MNDDGSDSLQLDPLLAAWINDNPDIDPFAADISIFGGETKDNDDPHHQHPQQQDDALVQYDPAAFADVLSIPCFCTPANDLGRVTTLKPPTPDKQKKKKKKKNTDAPPPPLVPAAQQALPPPPLAAPPPAPDENEAHVLALASPGSLQAQMEQHLHLHMTTGTRLRLSFGPDTTQDVTFLAWQYVENTLRVVISFSSSRTVTYLHRFIKNYEFLVAAILRFQQQHREPYPHITVAKRACVWVFSPTLDCWVDLRDLVPTCVRIVHPQNLHCPQEEFLALCEKLKPTLNVAFPPLLQPPVPIQHRVRDGPRWPVAVDFHQHMDFWVRAWRTHPLRYHKNDVLAVVDLLKQSMKPYQQQPQQQDESKENDQEALLATDKPMLPACAWRLHQQRRGNATKRKRAQ